MPRLSFMFNGVHSDDMGVFCNRIDVLLPALRKNTEAIPGQDGELDYGNNSYELRPIRMECCFIGVSHADMMKKRREVAAWLSEKGQLILSDEADKYYIGRCYNAAELTDEDTAGTFELLWEMESFAYGSNAIFQATGTSVVHVPVDYPGTKPACCRIIVQNRGNTPQYGISFTHIYRRKSNG